MSGTTGSPPADPAGTKDPQANQPASDARAGYTSPEEQQKLDSLNQQADDRGMNQNLAHQFQQHAAQDAAANAAAAGGGFKMDLATMKALAPQWVEIAHMLQDAATQGDQFKFVPQPATDDGSTIQMKAALQHAEAYKTSALAQQKYAANYATALQKAITDYENQEHAAADAVAKHGRQD
jgi:hypothetical protein